MLMFGFETYGGPEVTGFRQAAPPEAGVDRLVGRLVCAALNPADIKVRNGERRGKVRVEFPMAVGREACIALESDCGDFRAGDLVFGSCSAGTGALAETVALAADQAAAVPPGVDPAQAACIPVAIGTAWDALAELEVGGGDVVLILGAGGGVGSHAVQLARVLGAVPIGVAAASKAAILSAVGGHHVLAGAGWVERVKALHGGGVDAVLDTVGGPMLEEAFSLVAHPGRVRSCAAPTLAGKLGGSGIVRRRQGAIFAELATLVQSGSLVPQISSIHAFADAANAVAEVETGHAGGKVLVRA